METLYRKNGKYGRVYGWCIFLASLPRVEWGACLTGGSFYELDITPGFCAVLYLELLTIASRDKVPCGFPWLSYIVRIDER